MDFTSKMIGLICTNLHLYWRSAVQMVQYYANCFEINTGVKPVTWPRYNANRMWWHSNCLLSIACYLLQYFLHNQTHPVIYLPPRPIGLWLRVAVPAAVDIRNCGEFNLSYFKLLNIQNKQNHYPIAIPT